MMFLFVVKNGRKYTPTTLESGDIIIYDENTHALTAKRPGKGALLWYRAHMFHDVSGKFCIHIERTHVREIIELIASSLHLLVKVDPASGRVAGEHIFVLIN